MSGRASSPPLEGDKHAAALARCIGGRWVSEGRRLLRIVAQGSKQLAIAHELRVSEAYVGMLLAGTRRPRHEVEARIWLAYGIHAEAFGLAPTQRSVGLECSTAATSDRTLDSKADDTAAE